MRIVVDTNILVSALLSPSGPPSKVLGLILNGEVTLLISKSIFSEYQEVLSRKEFLFPKATVFTLLHVLGMSAEETAARSESMGLPDPDDEPFLHCAVQGKADFLVTGNKKDFPSSLTAGIKVVSPAELLNLLKEE